MRCPKCQSGHIIKKGFARRKLARTYTQRYQCKSCNTKFSQSSFLPTFKQKKTMINRPLFLDLCSGVSLRQAARKLNVSYGTVYRRFLWLGELAKAKHALFLQSYLTPSTLYLDEMETLEHTKLKPVSIPLLVDAERKILGVMACEIPAKGQLAEISRKKYGKRQNLSSQSIESLFAALSKEFSPALIKSDGKSSYRKLVQTRWPGAYHEEHVRKEEKKKEALFQNLEKKSFDPMFAINQRCAKLRDHVKRLARRSWCTTKKIENLTLHLVIYACYNNQVEVLA